MAVLSSGVFIAVIAQILIGASLVWDKVLLGQLHGRSVINYVFWLGAISIFGLALVPFGFKWPPPRVSALGIVAGIIHLAANLFYYRALQSGEASQTLTTMGGFSPTATALIGIAFRQKSIAARSMPGFVLMVAGGFFMFLSEKIKRGRILLPILGAAVSFGLTNVLQKMVFDRTNFVTGYVFFTLGTFAGAMMLLIRPSWRKQIVRSSDATTPRNRFWYFVNRFVNGVGSFLIFVALSLANPAIVDSIAGIRYVVIFLGTYSLTAWKPGWLHEKFSGWALTAKSIATLAIITGLILVAVRDSGGGEALTAASALLLLWQREKCDSGGDERCPEPPLPVHFFSQNESCE